ncbi:MAG: hypothetical protein QY332_18135 [Anaerolineales bacterium]|nr:MAG: hypothetical protein QY332_18135 [Anaerolineales bacterium]
MATKNEAVEANRIVMMEQWKIRSWLEGQAILKAQLEALKEEGAQDDDLRIQALKEKAAAQGFGAVQEDVETLYNTLVMEKAEQAVKEQVMQDFLSKERDTSAADAWLAQQQAQELQTGLMAYYLGRKAGEEVSVLPQDETWSTNAWNWAFNYQRELSLGTGIIAGLAAVAIVATATVTAPAWLIVGGAILATAVIVTAGTLAINSHFGLDLGNNLIANLVVGTAATLITAGIGLLVTSLAPVISTTIASTCTHYATACSQIGTIIDVGEEALLSAQIAYYTWTGNQDGAAQAAIELQLEKMDGGAPGNTVTVELGEQIVKLGSDTAKLITIQVYLD